MARIILSVILMCCLQACYDVTPKTTLYKAKQVIPVGGLADSKGAHSGVVNSVLVKGDRILDVGDYEQLAQQHLSSELVIDRQFEDKIIVPGFINQHDHPWLAALTLDSYVISIEDWSLPTGLYPKASNQAEYRELLKGYLEKHEDSESLFLSWGYHRLWHGKLNRTILDEINSDIPIAIWQRSVHEFIFNSKALELLEIDQAFIETLSKHQRSQMNLAAGHFWEAGLAALSNKLFTKIVQPKKYLTALYMIREYWQKAGTTQVVEPGGLTNRNLTIMQNAVFSSSDNPFHMDYIVDGKSMAKNHMDNLIEETEEVRTWGEGMSRYLPKQIKLLADGAVFSQLMKMSEGYLDGHHGEWIMEPLIFQEAFQKYWDAGYQIHVHQNGDAGLDMVLDVLEKNLKRNPREDHRTVIVHFSYSRSDQIERIKELGAVVSVNPYYPVALADMYSEVGVGPARSHSMVRLGELEKAGISYSLHSDMPMAPGRPLYLMWCAVNRITQGGNIVAPEQRITPEQALRAVTLDAAYSMNLEKDLGSIETGKFANMTILESNPLTVDPATIKDIQVAATIHEGRVFLTNSEDLKQTPDVLQLVGVYAELIWEKLVN